MLLTFILGLLVSAGFGIIASIYARHQGDKEGYARGYKEGKGKEYIRGYKDGETETIKYFKGYLG